MTRLTCVLQFGFFCLFASQLAWAEPTDTPAASLSPPPINTPAPNSSTTPAPPTIDAKGYVLMDAFSGKTLAAQNAEQRMPPASLTKMMTSYVISKALREGRIHMNDPVRISEKAWKTGGSKMFVQVGSTPTVAELMQGIIVDSGNDACVAMAEYVAGSEDAFVSLMNQQAAALGMKNTHYTDSTGLPNPQHYTTPHDIALLARALIQDFPEDYKWYSQKWFSYGGIKQPNRNRLLWRDPSADGIKTGHTDEAGYCLVASALRGNTRLISVVMGAPSDASRAENSQALLNYGFRFFETHKLYAAHTPLTKVRVWLGAVKELSLGVANDVFITIPPGSYAGVQAKVATLTQIKAPVSQWQTLGQIQVLLNGKTIATAPLIALQTNPKGNIWTRIHDHIALALQRFFSKFSA